METETARYRSTQTRHGGAVGWFVGHLEASRNKLEAKMTATLDKAPIPVRKRAVSSFEQVELWPGRAPSAVETMEALPEATPVIETVVQTACTSAHVEEVVETPARKPRGLSRKFVAASPVERMPAVQPARNIARFLKVNGAIDGVRSSTVRFDLPSRGLSQMLRLWRGSSETTEYIPVC